LSEDQARENANITIANEIIEEEHGADNNSEEEQKQKYERSHRPYFYLKIDSLPQLNQKSLIR